MYIYQLVEQLIQEYPPDVIKTQLPGDDETFNYTETPQRWWLEYGKLVISIGCGAYHYCDYYPLKVHRADFYYEHPHTETCAIAVYDRTVSHLGYTVGWVKPYSEDPQDARNEWTYARVSELRDIVETIYAYIKG